MIEFGVIVAAGLLSLLLAVIVGRPLLSRSVKVRLLTSAHGAVATGVRNYLRIFDRALAAIVALVCFSTFVGVGIVRDQAAANASTSSYALAGWIVVAVFLGATSSAVATHLTAQAMTRSSPRVDDTAKLGASDTLREGVQSAGAATLAFTAVLVLSLCCFALAAFAVSGGFRGDATPSASKQMVMLITAYGLGTVVTAVVSHTLGGVFVAAAASLEDETPAAALHRDVGIHLNVAVTRVADLFASIATASIAASILCVDAAIAAPETTGQSTAIALLPLMALAFSVLSSTVGLFVVRTDSAEPIASAIDRGLLVTFVLSTASFVGLTRWLFGSIWWRLFLSAASGLIVAMLVLLLERFFASLRSRNAAATTRRQPPFGAWGVGLQKAALLGTLTLAAFVGGFVVGRTTGIEAGGTLGLTMTALGMLAPAPFVLMTAAFSTVVSRFLDFGALDKAANQSAHRRLASLAVGGLPSARAYEAACTAVVAWLAVTAFSLIAGGNAAKSPFLGVTQVGVIFAGGMIGTLLVFWSSGAGLRAVGAVVRSTLASNEREHSHVDTNTSAMSDVASDRVVATLFESARHGIPVVLATIGIPIGLWAFMWFIAGKQSPQLAVIATVSLVFAASFVGLAASLAANAVGNSTSDGRKIGSGNATCDKSVDEIEKWAENRVDGAAVVGDTLGSPLQALVGPSINALVKLLAAAALALASLFF